MRNKAQEVLIYCRLLENPEKLPLGFARLPNQAISSEFLPCYSLDLAIQASNKKVIHPISFLSDELLYKPFEKIRRGTDRHTALTQP